MDFAKSTEAGSFKKNVARLATVRTVRPFRTKFLSTQRSSAKGRFPMRSLAFSSALVLTDAERKQLAVNIAQRSIAEQMAACVRGSHCPLR